MFAHLKKLSIRTQLMIIGSVILLFMFGIFVWSYSQIKHITFERNSIYTIELMTTIKENITTNIESFNRILPNIAFNELVQQYLMETDRLKQYELYQKLDPLLMNLQATNKSIVSIVLYSTAGGGIYNCISCERFIPFEEIPERTSAYYSNVRLYPYSIPNKYVVYVGMPVYDMKAPELSRKKIGYAVITLDADALAPPIAMMSDQAAGTFYVLDSQNIVAASNDRLNIGKRLIQWEDVLSAASLEEGRPLEVMLDRETYVVHMALIPEFRGKMISVFPMHELFKGLEDVQQLITIIFLVLIAVMLVLFVGLSRNILHPLQALMSFIYSIRSQTVDSMSRRIELEGYAEIHALAEQFNELLEESNQLAEELIASKTHIYELQLLKNQAELQYLKSQIHPHFLYNTLETIKGIAHVKGVQEIREMTDALSRIFRYSIKGDNVVRLREELETVKAYIRIQQFRFHDRFDVVYETHPECQKLFVTKMILQPLVENAVFHGIEPSMHRCRLTVGCRLDNEGHLILWVEDDGVGMEPTTLASLRNAIAKLQHASVHPYASAISQRHIGIMNVNRRIKLTYGNEYGITLLESALNQGTRVEMKIPAREGSNVQRRIGG